MKTPVSADANFALVRLSLGLMTPSEVKEARNAWTVWLLVSIPVFWNQANYSVLTSTVGHLSNHWLSQHSTHKKRKLSTAIFVFQSYSDAAKPSFPMTSARMSHASTDSTLFVVLTKFIQVKIRNSLTTCQSRWVFSVVWVLPLLEALRWPFQVDKHWRCGDSVGCSTSRPWQMISFFSLRIIFIAVMTFNAS